MTNKTNKMAEALALVGLAMRAGAVARGTDATRRAIQDGSASLVLLARDASSIQQQKVLRLLEHRETPRASVGSRVDLGAAIGSAPVSAIAITGESFAGQVLGRLSPEAEIGPAIQER